MSGPLAGLQDHRDRGHRPRPVLRHDAGRHGRRRRARRPGPERAAAATPPPRRPTCSNRGRRSVGVDLKHPDGVEAVLALVEQADGLLEGLPARRDGAPRPRPRRVPRPQPAARLRPHDRLGPGRARTRWPPATTSTTSRSPAPSSPIGRARRGPGAAAQPGRRLRRRRHAARLRHGVRARSSAQRTGRARWSTPPWSTAPPC